MRELTSFSVQKSTVELYKIRHPDGICWADITIDAHGTAGRISIASDYGNWQNYWGACGCSFKQFLSKIGKDYATSKFGVEPWLSVEGTVKLYKELLGTYRRDETIDAETARAVYREIEELSSVSRHELVHEVENANHLRRFIYQVCGTPEFEYEPDPHFVHFWQELWPVLLAEFAREGLLAGKEVPNGHS